MTGGVAPWQQEARNRKVKKLLRDEYWKSVWIYKTLIKKTQDLILPIRIKLIDINNKPINID